ncbi:MAG: formylglycine-generating enzyme family protein [Chloroflexi bacterium]|nr:formylglycine-generating enzyme family protein [Chloroflexota bacterium]
MMKVKLFRLIGLLIAFIFLTSASRIFTISHAAGSLDSKVYLPLILNNVIPHAEVFVPAGEFQMGCDPAHNGGFDCYNWYEQPLHSIYLDDYYIDKYEVTNAKYAAFLNNRGANDCGPYDLCADIPLTHLTLQDGKYVVEAGYENHPMNAVNWYGSEAYCAFGGRRLPTEAEWEKAARGSSDTRAFPWGDEDPNCTLANYRQCGGGDTTEVGSFPDGASPYGAMDMSGNLMEWVNDRWGDDYYSNSPNKNPQGPDSGNERMQRGAAYEFNEQSIRVAQRIHYFPQKGHYRIGFRCARSP